MGDWGRHREEQGGKSDIHTADRLRSRPGCHRARKGGEYESGSRKEEGHFRIHGTKGATMVYA